MQLVHQFGHRHELRHGPKRFAAEITVDPGQNHPPSPIGQARRHLHDAGVEKLGFINGDDLRHWIEPQHDLRGGVDGHGFKGAPIVAGDAPQPGVPVIQMRLEHLHAFPRNGGPSNAAQQLFGFPAEH